MLLSFKYSLAWGAFVAILLYIFRTTISSQFDENPEVILVSASYLLIVPFSYGAWGVLMMCSAIFNSLGKPISSTIMSIVRMFVIYVPLAYMGKYFFGFMGIFAAAGVSNLLMGILAFVWNRRTYVAQINHAINSAGDSEYSANISDA